MATTAQEIVLDLEPPVTAGDRRRYRASAVARPAPDQRLDVWLEFVDPDSGEVRRTGIETRQATPDALHHWATTLSNIYLRGALDRATLSRIETKTHRRALAQAAARRGATVVPDPFRLFELGEHVLRRELQLCTRARLFATINEYRLNPTGVDLSRFTRAQLVAFIVATIEAREIQRARA